MVPTRRSRLRTNAVALVPLVALSALGLGLSRELGTRAQEREIADTRKSTEIIAALGIQATLTADDIEKGLSPERLSALRRRLNAELLHGDVRRIKIWNRAGKVVYSDDASAIGQRFPISEELAEALDGETASELSRPNEAENRNERHDDRLIEVYVPIRFGTATEPVGAFEIYRAYAPIEAAVAQERRTTVVLILVAVVLCYLALLRIWRDARRLRRRAAKNEFLALHDPLTQLANRTLFKDRVERAIRASARDGTACAVLFVDLDDFKKVNDTLGHAAGDEALMMVAERLGSATRAPDSVARLGGDEFAVLVEDVNRPHGAARVAERILEVLRQPLSLHGQSVSVAASVGIAVSSGEVTADELLRNADVAMYWAKSVGKGVFEFFEPTMYTAVVERFRLESEIRQGVVNREFIVHYQPVVELATGRISGVEALVRWNHPVLGVLKPDRFLSVAEETGSVAPLGKWVLEQACRQVSAWQRDHAMPGLSVSVNLSTKQLAHRDLVEMTAAALASSGLQPTDLILEITETSLLKEIEGARANIDGLRRLGVRLALDDFGTGYSSLSHLQAFAVDLMKIDRSFVHGVAADARQLTLLNALASMGKALGLTVVAEGVERAEDVRVLLDHGVAYAQGYHYSEPLDPGALGGFLTRARTEQPDGEPFIFSR